MVDLSGIKKKTMVSRFVTASEYFEGGLDAEVVCCRCRGCVLRMRRLCAADAEVVCCGYGECELLI